MIDSDSIDFESDFPNRLQLVRNQSNDHNKENETTFKREDESIAGFDLGNEIELGESSGMKEGMAVFEYGITVVFPIDPS